MKRFGGKSTTIFKRGGRLDPRMEGIAYRLNLFSGRAGQFDGIGGYDPHAGRMEYAIRPCSFKARNRRADRDAKMERTGHHRVPDQPLQQKEIMLRPSTSNSNRRLFKRMLRNITVPLALFPAGNYDSRRRIFYTKAAKLAKQTTIPASRSLRSSVKFGSGSAGLGLFAVLFWLRLAAL